MSQSLTRHCPHLPPKPTEQKWHEDRPCSDVQQAGYRFYLCRSDVRPCPTCGVRVEKNGGCPSMYCSRCKVYFCWSCMATDQECNGRFCIPLCPRLPFALCINLLITIGAILLCPLVFTLGPIIAAIIAGLCTGPAEVCRMMKR